MKRSYTYLDYEISDLLQALHSQQSDPKKQICCEWFKISIDILLEIALRQQALQEILFKIAVITIIHSF